MNLRLKLEERINQLEQRTNILETENEAKFLKMTLELENKTEVKIDEIESRFQELRTHRHDNTANNTIQIFREKLDNKLVNLVSKINDSEIKSDIKSIRDKISDLENKYSEKCKTMNELGDASIAYLNLKPGMN